VVDRQSRELREMESRHGAHAEVFGDLLRVDHATALLAEITGPETLRQGDTEGMDGMHGMSSMSSTGGTGGMSGMSGTGGTDVERGIRIRGPHPHPDRIGGTTDVPLTPHGLPRRQRFAPDTADRGPGRWLGAFHAAVHGEENGAQR
jgi:hypothetical protein